MCKEIYVNIQIGEVLDCDKVESLKPNALLKVIPHLWEQWDFEKNDELGFDIWKITKGSGNKVWWICKDCKSSYVSSVVNRVIGKACPYCSGVKVNHTNCLANKNPKLASEWHPTKNGDLTPYEVTCNKGSKVWWKCKNNHEWEATICNRNNTDGCPYCRGRYATKENCLAVLNPKLASEWHPKKNGDLTPHDVLPNRNKKAWWLGECGHEWESKINGRNNGNGCPVCRGFQVLKGYNDIHTTNHDLGRLFANHEDGYKYTQNSVEKADFRCPNCNNIEKNKVILNVKNRGLSCSKCSDGISFPEKVVLNLFKSLNIEFIKELSFEWLDSKRYDFYIPSLSLILETHGLQHFEEVNGWRSLEEERENDRVKRELALSNGVKHYIELDCRDSSIEYIRNSILNSELVTILNLSNVNWTEIAFQSEKSLVIEACELWVKGLAVKEIADELDLKSSTVYKYLKKGVKLGICTYNEKESRTRGNRKAWKIRKDTVM